MTSALSATRKCQPQSTRRGRKRRRASALGERQWSVWRRKSPNDHPHELPHCGKPLVKLGLTHWPHCGKPLVKSAQDLPRALALLRQIGEMGSLDVEVHALADALGLSSEGDSWPKRLHGPPLANFKLRQSCA